MTNPSKIKGSKWENDAADLLNKEFPNTWRRTPMSGALGTIMNEPLLGADVLGKYEFLPFKFLAEAKVGYGGSNMQIKKDWFDKIKSTAEKAYGIPVVLLKFLGARSGVKHVIAMDFETWNKLMAYIELLHDRENDKNLRNLE